MAAVILTRPQQDKHREGLQLERTRLPQVSVKAMKKQTLNKGLQVSANKSSCPQENMFFTFFHLLITK